LKKHRVEVVIHDPIAQQLAHLFLPQDGTHVSPDELKDACTRLAEATIAFRRLQEGCES
jgi:hypothetical protein